MKRAKAKPKVRRVVLGNGLPVFQGAEWVSLVDRFGGRLYLRQSNLKRGTWIRLVAEVLPNA